MTPALMHTLCDHTLRNYRVMTTMAAELLNAAAQRETRQLDEKLFDVFAHPPRVTPTSTPRRPPASGSAHQALAQQQIRSFQCDVISAEVPDRLDADIAHCRCSTAENRAKGDGLRRSLLRQADVVQACLRDAESVQIALEVFELQCIHGHKAKPVAGVPQVKPAHAKLAAPSQIRQGRRLAGPHRDRPGQPR